MGIHADAADVVASAISNARPSIRAMFTERRTYLRPLDEDGLIFETPRQAMDRVLGHQRWLWETQLGRALNLEEEAELAETRGLMEAKKVSVSGRVKWMGGTDLVKKRAAACFNCTFSLAQRPADLVDIFWLLLQGSGVGFKPLPGLLAGLPQTIIEVETIGSTRTDRGGAEDTTDWIDGDTWTIKFGDSAKAWAKALGVLAGHKPRVKKLVLDFSELRPGGKRLRGYGWLSSGWKPLEKGMLGIAKVLMRRGDALLTSIDIGDIINWLGTVLSSRRAAESWIREVTQEEWIDILLHHEDFIEAKTNRWEKGEGQREQSNNSLVFMTKPSRDTIVHLLKRILDTGEPGFVNGVAARKRAPEMEGLNPCFEILLADGAVCNLMQVVWHRFNGDFAGLIRAQYLAGRANYRQTCVSMRDGVLQLKWNDNQKLLRLCGVSPTGYVAWEGLNNPEMLEAVAYAAREGAYSMADDFGLQRPRRVTQVQPAGTSSKALGLEGDEVHEGAHCADSRWIFNNINFSTFDPIVDVLKAANYRVQPNPVDPTGVLVTFPVEYPASPLFTEEKRIIDGVEHHLEINRETAITQLERYRYLMNHYVDNNCFSARTKFLTSQKGMAAFDDFNDGDEVEVMNRAGKWTKATVKQFGEQKVWRVTLDRAGTKHIIETTAGHRWPVQSANDRYRGREIWTTTDKLTEGANKNLVTILPELDLAMDDEYILRGITFGDGTTYNYPNVKAKITLCRDASNHRRTKVDLLSRFEAAGYKGTDATRDGYRTVHGLPAEWKLHLPSIEDCSPKQLRGFIAGWFATDGSVSGTSATISASNRSVLEWLQFAAAKAGISVMTEIKEQLRSGYSADDKPIYSLTFAKASLTPDFFILDWKKLDGEFEMKHWTIVSVEETDQVEPVFCVVEPIDHEFVLEGNILTGNCSITVSFDEDEIDHIADWFMRHWDEYVGVSFLKRNDPEATAEELGFSYLPQEAVSRETFRAYADTLLPVDISGDTSEDMLDLGGCATGACPVR